MCMYSKTNEVKKAAKDIVCYKELSYFYYEGKYVTPYVFTEVKDNIIRGEEFFKAKGKMNIRLSGLAKKNLMFMVGQGFIHTYKNFPTQKVFGKNTAVFKCIIPKGTNYIEGTNYKGNLCYASRKIKFVEKIISEG